ncbi:MAG: CapA family protein [Desulfobacter sp.]|nr:MAG: CapA family protein [Desulfobacter sp.]
MKDINFKTGTWSNGRGPVAHMMIAGDWAPIREFAPLIEKNPEGVYGDLLPLIREADLSLVNLEAPLSDTGAPVTKSGAVFKGNVCHVEGLAAVPFDAVTLANNHMFDFGTVAFKETINALESRNIRHTGAGMDLDEAKAPLILETCGLKVAVVNFSEGEDLTAAGKGPGVMGWDLETVAAQIKTAKAEADAVVAVVHCGLEYIPYPPAYVIDAFKAVADAGADAVIGHHPHVPQGIFIHKGVPVCCSLGNFVFYQPTKFHWRKLGYMVNLKLAQKGVAGFDIIPYRIHDTGVSLLQEEEENRFFQRLEEISLPLFDEENALAAWNGFIDYYGTAGFKNEVNMILGKMEGEEPGKGAAMFRNRLTTAQHFYHWKDLLTRIVDNKMGDSPQWARDIAEEWLTREIQ